MAARDRDRKSIGGELIVPVGALAFTLYYFSTIIESPWTAQVSAFFVGAILIFLVLVFVAKSVLALVRGHATLAFDSVIAPASLVSKRLVLLALTLGYVFVIEWGGFTLTSFVFLFFTMVLLGDGRNKRMALAISASLSICGYLLFILAFETRFPEGPFEQFVKAVF